MKANSQGSYILLSIFTLLTIICCCPHAKILQSEKVDSVKVTKEVEYIEKLRDTTIYVPMPIEVIHTVVEDSSYIETSLAFSFARINADGSLYHTIENIRKNIAVIAQVKDVKSTVAIDSTKLSTSYQDRPVPMNPSGWQKFMYISGIVGWSLLIVFGGIWLQKKLWPIIVKIVMGIRK